MDINMSEAQFNYTTAKIALEAAREISSEQLAPYESMLERDDVTEAEMNEFDTIAAALDEELNIKELTINLRRAENELIDWMVANISKFEQFAAAKADVEAVVNSKNNIIRMKVIDLALRLV